MSRFLFCSILAVAGLAEVTAAEIKVFPIFFHSVKNRRHYRSCTAQFYKFGKTCDLISALHCARDGFTAAVIEVDGHSYGMRTKKGFAEIDTVALESNSYFDELCGKLEDITPEIFDPESINGMGGLTQLSMRVRGFAGGRLHTQYTRNFVWERDGAYPAAIESVNTGDATWLNPLNLQVFPGDSGGVVEARGNRNVDITKVGMAVRYVPFQDQAIVVPHALIARYLHGPARPTVIAGKGKSPQPTVDLEYERKMMSYMRKFAGSSKISSWQVASDNIFVDTADSQYQEIGDNGHKGTGGENATAPIGDNAHKGTIEAQRYNDDYVMGLLREPNEGIVDPKNPRQIILGIGNWQVDGHDDYKQLEAMIGHEPVIVRDNSPDSYPAANIREGILKRFQGFYHPIAKDGLHELIHKADPTAPWGWVLDSTNPNFTDVDVHGDSIWFKNGRNLTPGPGPRARQASFTFTMDREAKTITLTQPDGFIWRCPNQHYLKIICAPEDKTIKATLSLSKGQSGQSVITVRYAIITKENGVKEVDYNYGKLDQTTSPGKFRR